MVLSLAALVGFLGALGTVQAENIVPRYKVELVIRQGTQGAGEASIVARPTLVVQAGQFAHITTGQEVRMWGNDARCVGMTTGVTIRSEQGTLVLALKTERSELDRDTNGNPLVNTVQMETERPFRLGEPLVIQPVRSGAKELWVEVRVEEFKE